MLSVTKDGKNLKPSITATLEKNLAVSCKLHISITSQAGSCKTFPSTQILLCPPILVCRKNGSVSQTFPEVSRGRFKQQLVKGSKWGLGLFPPRDGPNNLTHISEFYN